MTSEQLLTEYARTKNADLFAELVRRHTSLVASACLRVLRNRDLAEDALQETWMKVLQHAGTFSGASSAATWIYKIARNAAVAMLRKRISSQRLAEAVSAIRPEGYSADPLDGLITAESCRYVSAALQTLSSDNRRVIELTEIWGQLESEAAATMGIPLGTVKSRKHRGMFQLRKILLAA